MPTFCRARKLIAPYPEPDECSLGLIFRSDEITRQLSGLLEHDTGSFSTEFGRAKF
jgi:hypothetical protein